MLNTRKGITVDSDPQLTPIAIALISVYTPMPLCMKNMATDSEQMRYKPHFKLMANTPSPMEDISKIAVTTPMNTKYRTMT